MQLASVAASMVGTLRHRGPNDAGVWADADAGLAFAHARLSIIDVSACGHQPMVSQSGRYVLVFNGEIYNFREVRKSLETLGCRFRGDSDTEVLLEAIAAWGVREAVTRITGMFAFAVWNRDAQTLVLARDRIGEKPLYYGWIGSALAFASELKALRCHPAWQGTIDRDALTLYLRHGYVPGPYTIYSGIRKLQPGCLLAVTAPAVGHLPDPTPYWSLEEIPAPRALVRGRSDTDVVDSLEQLLRHAVQQQMVADVPLGAFLSGGIDSATVVALMQAESARPVRTFTIGVDDPAHDEATAARSIAAHLGTAHTELYVRAEDALAMVPRLGRIYDEPFGDSSQIPTLLVSELARRSVTVALSGDGGDELFGGYATYQRGSELNRQVTSIPAPLRRPVGRALLARPTRAVLSSVRRRQGSRAVDRTLRLGEILGVPSPLGIHRALHTDWVQPATIVVRGHEPVTLFTRPQPPWSDRVFAERMLLVDACTYLPDDLLVKVDRAAMSVGLETRVPMLDHRIVEFAARLPWHFKVRGAARKWVLRQVLHRHVPPELMDRPKQGFSVPIAQWLRGPLRGWATRLLDSDRLADEGLLRARPIAARWAEHLNGTCDWGQSLWTVLMFQAWYESVAA